MFNGRGMLQGRGVLEERIKGKVDGKGRGMEGGC